MYTPDNKIKRFLTRVEEKNKERIEKFTATLEKEKEKYRVQLVAFKSFLPMLENYLKPRNIEVVQLSKITCAFGGKYKGVKYFVELNKPITQSTGNKVWDNLRKFAQKNKFLIYPIDKSIGGDKANNIIAMFYIDWN